MARYDSFLTRREALKLAGMTLAGSLINGGAWPLNVRAAGKANPLGTARYGIMIEMSGAMSPMDCWDFKETKWTAKDLEPQKVWSDLTLSKTLFPKLIESKQMDRVSFVRSMRAKELVHFVGQYHVQAGRAQNVAVGKEIPAFGSVIAAELDSQRRPSDTFPTYMSTALSRNRVGAIGSGFFPAQFSGMDLDPGIVFDIFGAKDDTADQELQRRWQALMRLGEVSSADAGALEDKGTEYGAFYDYSYRILRDPRWAKIFQVGDEEKKRYGNKPFGLGCILAKNLISADAGTRFVYISDTIGWDHHSYIFDRTKPSNHYVAAAQWDQGFTALLEDLASMPGHAPGKSLLDETLVVSSSEFGRMPYMNSVAGRDHYNQAFTSLLAGGGSKGRRVLGKTNEDGSKCIDTGWKDKKQPVLDNLVATFYSTLGIDWKKSVAKTPSGRPYDYVQAAPIGSNEFISTDPFEDLFV